MERERQGTVKKAVLLVAFLVGHMIYKLHSRHLEISYGGERDKG